MRYVLQLVVAKIDELDWHLVADLLVDTARNTDAARIGERLKAFGDIDPVAEQVALFDDHVAQIDADAEQHPLRFRCCLVEQPDRSLNLETGLERIDCARKLGDDAVAGSAKGAASTMRNCSNNHVPPLAERSQRALLVLAHLSRKADRIRDQDRCEFSGRGALVHTAFPKDRHPGGGTAVSAGGDNSASQPFGVDLAS